MAAFPAAYYETRFRLARDPGPAPFAIITAHNPMDRRLSPQANRRADLRLARLLARRRLPRFRATGHAPDGAHAEPGWAIDCDRETAGKFARHFHQRALWWIETDRLELVDSHNGARECLGAFSPRITIGPDA